MMCPKVTSGCSTNYAESPARQHTSLSPSYSHQLTQSLPFVRYQIDVGTQMFILHCHEDNESYRVSRATNKITTAKRILDEAEEKVNPNDAKDRKKEREKLEKEDHERR